MDDLNIIDQFTQTFVSYIDSGFGLLSPDIAFLTTILIGIDITLAGLLWAMADDKSILPALIKKVLYIGAFAYIINNFSFLSRIIFESFAGLGLRATGTGLSISDLMRPGFIAATGYEAAEPILLAVSDLLGPVAFFENFITIAVLMLAWAVVLLAFFILAIQLFITILEFKITTLAGFVLIPFALWNKTSFLAEKVLGNVVSSGIKLMVLAVIVGIGSTVFSAFTNSFTGPTINLEQALSTVLAALSLFMLGIFGPGIAAGLVSGAPQLGAGAVAGTALGLGVGAAAAGRMAGAGAGAAASGVSGAVKAGSAMAGGASASYNLARATSAASGSAGVAVGVSGVAKAGAGAVRQGMGKAAGKVSSGVKDAYQSGGRAAFTATGGALPKSTTSAGAEHAAPNTPDWAHRLQSQQHRQHMREGAAMTAHTLRDGDRSGSGDSPRLKDSDE
ncbi:MAG: P-type conjugative transfer protein TrbL [Rhizobiaceae bacterium]|nr:P-type conjugative transfer protein TrbL [Rhizobiaceae bacterium]